MPNRFHFEPDILHSVAGGRSAVDIPKLNIHNKDEADSFLLSYGFNAAKVSDLEKLWYFFRRALVLLIEKLDFKIQDVPELLRDQKSLKEIQNLLIFASSTHVQQSEIQKWSCAILRAMHVYVHAEYDLFGFFSEEIQNQILTPFQNTIFVDGNSHHTYLKSRAEGQDLIEILKFETKPFKTSSSTVIKLLAKPDALAMRIFDKLGVRFITRSVFDSFQVIRFLVQEHIISFPHIMPDQSSNNLYPTDLFIQVTSDLAQQKATLSEIKLSELFETKLTEKGENAQFLRKENLYSGSNYRFIKFISRKLIHIQPDANKPAFSFFFPYEVQIVDHDSYLQNTSGPSDHQSYKDRQKEAARKRLFRVDTK